MPEVASLSDLTERPHDHVFEDPPRTVRLHLDAGESVPEHRHHGEWVLIHVLEGAITVTIDRKDHELAAGKLVRFHGDREVSPEASEESVALVTFVQDVE